MGLRERLEKMDSETLKEIYRINDRTEWPKEGIEWASEILEERGEELPDQSPPKKRKKTLFSNQNSKGKDYNAFQRYFSFRNLITSGLIRIFYFLGFLGITIASVVAIGQGEGGPVGAGFLGITIGNVVWRVFCESLIIIFDMHDRLTDLHDILRDNLHALEDIQQAIEEGQEGNENVSGSQ